MGRNFPAHLLLFFLLLSGCAGVIAITNKNPPSIRPESKNETGLCTRSTNVSVLGPQVNLNADFLSLLDNPGTPKDLEAQMVFWTLFNITANPLSLGPKTNFILFSLENSSHQTFHFQSEENGQSNLLDLLLWLQRKSTSKLPLKKMAAILQDNFLGTIKVNNFLNNDLQKYSTLIEKNPVLKNQFTRAGERLNMQESFSPINFVEIVDKLERNFPNKKSQPVSLALPYIEEFKDENRQLVSRCNFDQKKLRQGQFEIQKESDSSLIFGLKSGSKAYLIVSYFNPAANSTPSDFDKLPILLSNNAGTPPPLCEIESRLAQSNRNEIHHDYVFALNSRGGDQLLAQLVQYLDDNKGQAHDLWDVLESPLFLFLNSPDRIIFTKKDGQDLPPPYDQLATVSNFQIPRFYYEDVGNILSMQSAPELSNFALRNPSQYKLTCFSGP